MLFIFVTVASLFAISRTTVSLLLISELFWITFYFATLLIAMLTDNVNFAALSLFCLIFSSIEISVGISLVKINSKVTKTYNV